MQERKPRATRADSINAKIATNLEAQAKLVEKLDELKAVETELRNSLKKAERAAAAKAKREAKKAAEKELLKAIKKSGMSVEDVKEKLGL